MTLQETDFDVENKEISEEGESSSKISREEVLEKLFNSYNYGNLGLFIGAGFSKAVITESWNEALSWIDLIKQASSELSLNFPSDKELLGVSLPEVATKLCNDLGREKGITYNEAKSIFKNKICQITNWLPSEEKTNCFRELLNIIDPEWIITTNYDLVLETILTGKCKSLSPSNYLSARKGVVPIYHIHGTRLDSDSIIITQDDYIPLFRPNEYRQSKLAMTIRESTVLVLGYSLGDMNVLSAIDWSKNIYNRKNEYPHEIIQAVWTDSPKKEPYRDENGNIIIEISDLEKFLEEVADFMIDEKEEYDNRLKELDKLVGQLDGYDAELVNNFKTSSEFRLKLLELISEFEYNMVYVYIEFFIRCLDEVWFEARKDGGFEEYNTYLLMILDIIVNYQYCQMPPKLFKILAKSLDNVLYYVGKNKYDKYYGDSWGATETWHSRKKEIPKDIALELYNYSQPNWLYKLSDFMKDLID